MKNIKYNVPGLIGGIGPGSTLDYYKNIIRIFREKSGSDDYPQFFINSINMTEMLEYVRLKDFRKLTSFLAEEINKLEIAGADFGILASNTPHIVFNELQKEVKIPLISIVDETCKAISKSGIKKTVLFGTMSTMKGGFYQKAGKEHSVEIITPDESSMEFINKVYFEELVHGIFKEKTKNELIKIAEKMRKESGISGLILGGTELPLILNQEYFKEIIIFDTMQIHINSVINKMLGT